jgi:hypothetical protein
MFFCQEVDGEYTQESGEEMARRAYLILNDSNIEKSFKERFRVIVDSKKAFQVIKDMGYGVTGWDMFGVRNSDELEKLTPGMMVMEKGGGMDIRFMAIEIEE